MIHKKLLKILIIDDNTSNLYYLARNFENDGFFIRLAKSYKEAKYHVREEIFDFIICRDVVKDESISNFVKFIKRFSPKPHLIIMCNNEDQYISKDWFNSPLVDFIILPVRYVDLMDIISKHYVHDKAPVIEIDLPDYPVKHIIARSAVMRELIEQVKRYANSKSSILIQGESGSGKEIIARLIHYYSPRRNNPFIAVNCSAIPESLMESELFGYEKGAFTGATRQHKGLFEMANSGTIFLDEIGEMSVNMQTKLLRVLELKEFYKVGGNQSITSDVRVLAATNRNLEEMLKQKTFREDLLYRIMVVQLTVPPLRSRIEDIPFLTKFFLNQSISENQIPPKEISRNAMELFLKYEWPGNVRELKNVVERLSLSVEGDLITADDVKSVLNTSQKEQNQIIELNIGTPLEAIEKEVILATLRYCNYNRTKTAKMLGIGLRTLQRKLKKYQ